MAPPWKFWKRAASKEVPDRSKWDTAGFLEEKSCPLGSWKKRYCILEQKNLYVCHDKRDFVGREHFLDLTQSMDFELERHRHAIPRGIFRITDSKGQTLKLRVKGEEEAAYWMSELWSRIFKSSSIPPGAIESGNQTSASTHSEQEIEPPEMLSELQGRTHLLERRHQELQEDTDSVEASCFLPAKAKLSQRIEEQSNNEEIEQYSGVTLNKKSSSRTKRKELEALLERYASVNNRQSSEQHQIPMAVQCPFPCQIPDAPPLPEFLNPQNIRTHHTLSLPDRSNVSENTIQIPKKSDPLMEELKLRLKSLNLDLGCASPKLSREDSVIAQNSMQPAQTGGLNGIRCRDLESDFEDTERLLIEESPFNSLEPQANTMTPNDTSLPENSEESNDVFVSIEDPTDQSSDSRNAELIREATALMRPLQTEESERKGNITSAVVGEEDADGDQPLPPAEFKEEVEVGNQDECRAYQCGRFSVSVGEERKPVMSPASHTTTLRRHHSFTPHFGSPQSLLRRSRSSAEKQLIAPASHTKPSAVGYRQPPPIPPKPRTSFYLSHL